MKLALLLSLFSSSLILKARLPGPDNSGSETEHQRLSRASFPMAIILFILALVTILAGCFEYISNCADMRGKRAFLFASKYVRF
jgi:hypothetical protein